MVRLLLLAVVVGVSVSSSLRDERAYGQSAHKVSARQNDKPREVEARYGSGGGTAKDRHENERLREYVRSESERRVRNFALRYTLREVEGLVRVGAFFGQFFSSFVAWLVVEESH